MKRSLAIVLVLLFGLLPTASYGWEVLPYPKDKQVVATTFAKMNGATTDKRPGGLMYYQLSIVCTNGFFEVDLFKINPGGDLAILGNVTSVAVQTQEKGRQSYNVVNLGQDALRFKESKKFYSWILDQKRIGIYFRMETREEYRAYFDVSGAAGLAKKFASVGCKV
jgi:hypothetical protein